MEKLTILQKQLNSCEWEIVCSSKNIEVINKAKAELKAKNIKYKLSHYKGTPIHYPYRITFINLLDNSVEIRISINISNCLENESVKTEDVVIRKKENSFTVYLWSINEDKAYFEASKLYRIHSEYLLRQTVSKVSNNRTLGTQLRSRQVECIN